MSDLTIIYYTSNYLDTQNPIFLENTKKQLLEATRDHQIVSVSHKPIDLGRNVCVGDIGRSHLNIYRQILIGCKAADTEWVAMAEDDILYSPEHFDFKRYIKPKDLERDVFIYDMNKLSIFTWTKPPMFSFRTNRKVVNQLIAKREMLIDAMEERFARLDKLLEQGKTEEQIIKYWGDPGRYEGLLGVKTRECIEVYCNNPSIVFTHPKAFGYEMNHGKKKRLGDLRIIEVPYWGRAEEVLKSYYQIKEGNYEH